MEILNHFYAVFALPYKWHNQFISKQLIIGKSKPVKNPVLSAELLDLFKKETKK
jgi:hypothetical protein